MKKRGAVAAIGPFGITRVDLSRLGVSLKVGWLWRRSTCTLRSSRKARVQIDLEKLVKV